MKVIVQMGFGIVLLALGYLAGLNFPIVSLDAKQQDFVALTNLSSKENRIELVQKNHNVENLAEENTSNNKTYIVSASSLSMQQGINEGGQNEGSSELSISELSKLRAYRAQTEIDKHNEYLQRIGGGDAKNLSTNFANEIKDANWAQPNEKLLNEKFEHNKSLASIPHLAPECHSKQCRISVLSDDQFYLNKLNDSLSEIVVNNENSFANYSTVVDEATHTTSIYFERNTKSQ